MPITSGIRIDFALKIAYVYTYTIPPMEGRIVSKYPANWRMNDTFLPTRRYQSRIIRATCKIALLLRYEVTGSFLTVVAGNQSFNSAQEREREFRDAQANILRPSRANIVRKKTREKERKEKHSIYLL